MNKKYRYPVFFIFTALVGVIAFSPRFAAAQASPTATSTATFTDTPTSTPSATLSFTPTIVPTETQLHTVVPIDTQTPMPTPYSIADIHSEFERDFENINVQLTAIYDQVYSPPGSSIIEGLAVEFLADAIKPSPESNARTYVIVKFFGTFSVVVKTIAFVVRKRKDESKFWIFSDNFFGVIVFFYAVMFIFLLFNPSIFEGKPQLVSPQEVNLTKIENQLSEITQYLRDHTISPSAEVSTDTGHIEINNVEIQLSDISKQLEEISTQNTKAINDNNNRLNSIESQVNDTKAATAKSFLQVVNFFLLVAILVISWLRGDVNSILRRFG